MKKHLYFFAAALMAATVSCSDDFTQEELPEGGIAVKATIENIDTRAAINGTKVIWSAGDEIGILLNNGKYAQLTLKSADAGKATGSFTGALIGDVAIASDAHAFYPYDICLDPTHVKLPASYNVGSDFANSHAYMRASVDGTSLSFSHLGGVVKLILKGVPANSAQIVYTVLDNQNIVGEFALSSAGSATQIETSVGTGEYSSLSLGFDAISEKSDLTIFLPMPIGTYKGVKLEIKDTNGNNTIEPVSFKNATLNVSRANLLSMPTLTFVEFTTAGEAWDGETYTEVTPKSQTIEGNTYNVYEVNKPDEFAWTAKNVANDNQNVYIKLNSDVNLGENDFTPFGNVERSAKSGFAGVIDGGGNTITGLKASATGEKYGVGLVAVAKNATIKNVNIDGADLSSEDFAGAVVGCSLGDVTISNCNVTNSTINSTDKCGGIVGRSYGTTTNISDCIIDKSVEIQGGTNAGGVVGIINCTTTITGCTNNAQVKVGEALKAGDTGGAGYGGIVGYMAQEKTAVIDGCTNNGVVGASNSKYSGGICGYVNGNPASFKIQNCTNTGDVIGSDDAGGIFGSTGQYGPLTVTGCTNSGKIQASTFAGGIAAQSGGGSASFSYFTNCTNTGCVSANYAGGVFGQIQYAQVKNCSGGGSAAVINGSTYKGRIAALVANGPTAYAILYINDSNGDDYDSMGTIGCMSLGTAWAQISIASGTFRGLPYCNGNTSHIKIEEGASWTSFPGETGTWQCSAGSYSWTKM